MGGNHLDIMLVGPEAIDVPTELYCPRTGEACDKAVQLTVHLPGLASDESLLGALEKVVSRCEIDETRACALGQRAIHTNILESIGGAI